MQIELPTELEAQLRDMARQTREPVEAHLNKAVASYLADHPDLERLDQRRAEVRAGDVVTLEDMKIRLGLED